MIRTLTQAERDQLESLVDSTSLQNVLDALAGIASDKAEHILVNWQDRYTAITWENAARGVGVLAGKVLV